MMKLFILKHYAIKLLTNLNDCIANRKKIKFKKHVKYQTRHRPEFY